MSKDVVTSFRVDSELWKKARIYAVEQEITIRNFIESLIRQELEERRLEEKLKNSGQQKLSGI
jgi:predicted HicB family RNase H-like nuclease